MQKKIIVLAIAAALTTPALALADNAATLYGQANLSVDMVNDGAVTNSSSVNQLNSNTSRLGLKGSEDLGGGNSFMYQMEGKVNMDKGNAFAFDRDTFVGLKNDSMGTLVLGQHDTPYKMATRKLDLFGDGIADNRGNQSSSTNTAGAASYFSAGTMMGGGHDARLGNLIAYVSPSFSGVTVIAATMFGAETSAQGAGPALTKGSGTSLSGTYEQGPIYAALAYQTVTFGSNGTGDLAANDTIGKAFGAAPSDKGTAFKLGGSYSMDQFAVNLVYERLSATFNAGGDSSSTNIYVAGKFNVSSTDAAKLAYTKRGTVTITGVDQLNDATQISVGYDHAMSKTTTVYALYSKLTQNVAGVAGAAPTVLSLGMKHSF